MYALLRAKNVDVRFPLGQYRTLGYSMEFVSAAGKLLQAVSCSRALERPIRYRNYMPTETDEVRGYLSQQTSTNEVLVYRSRETGQWH